LFNYSLNDLCEASFPEGGVVLYDRFNLQTHLAKYPMAEVINIVNKKKLSEEQIYIELKEKYPDINQNKLKTELQQFLTQSINSKIIKIS